MVSVLGEVVEKLGGSPRPQQAAMVAATNEAFAVESCAIVQAGTGTGKSFAYISSIVDQFKAEQKLKGAESSRRAEEDDEFKAVVATSSIALQQQLVEKDLPNVLAAVAPEMKFGILKGKSNYVCPLKVEELGANIQNDLFTKEGEGIEVAIEAANNGLKSKQEADKTTLKFWQHISAGTDECIGKKCPHYEECPSVVARQELEGCEIIVTNHHLYGMHVSGIPVLPKHSYAVIDEAHKYSDIVAAVNSKVLDTKKFVSATKKLYAAVPNTGNLINKLRSVFSKDLTDELKNLDGDRIPDEHKAWEAISELREVAAMIDEEVAKSRKKGGSEEQKALQAWAALSATIKETRLSDNVVVWCRHKKTKEGKTVEVMTSQISPTKVIADSNKQTPTLYTSATLHSRIDEELALKGLPVSRVGSPFQYERSAMFLDISLPEPSDPQFRAEADKTILKFVEASGGAALVLYTSYKAMKESAEFLRRKLSTPVIVQGEESTAELSEKFKNNESTTLLGTATFWEGVDFPGDTLKTVIIDKIPFPNFGDPLAQAKREKLGNGFMLHDIPKAETMLLQGAGRLVRTETDSGVIVLLDKRVKTKRYGKILTRNLPKFKRTVNEVEALDVLGGVGQGRLL